MRHLAVLLILSPLKMLFFANAFEISNIQEAQTEGPLTRRSECNNVALKAARWSFCGPPNFTLQSFDTFLRNDGNHDKTSHRVGPPQTEDRIEP